MRFPFPFLGLIAGALHLSTAGAAESPARPAKAEPRLFEGVNLDELPQMRRMQDMPEIYERDPANGRRYRRRPGVLQVQLGAGWLYFNPESDVSYVHVNTTPGRGEAIYYGPIDGDAFVTFKLEDRFIAKLRQDYADNVPGQIEQMLRTGNAKLRERAIRIMTAGLASDISAETRAYHVGKFRELASSLTPDEGAALRAAITQTEKRIDELTVTLPDSEYNPGNESLEKQGKLADWMKPSVPVPATAWGEAVNGLRAAAVYSTTKPKLGEKVTVWLLVKNASDKVIRFSSHDVVQSAQAKVTTPDGREVRASGSWYTGMAPIQRHKLNPGERLTLAQKHLVFDAKNGKTDAGFGGGRIAEGPGEYRVIYESILTTGTSWARQEDGLMHRVMPAKGEWTGSLVTAETTLTVPGDPEKPAADVPAAGKPAPARDPATPAKPPAAIAPKAGAGPATKSIRVTALDANGRKPIKEFRVIAGVKSMTDTTRDVEIINWQPHTLRVGRDGVLNWPTARGYDPMAFRVEADGYAPQKSAWMKKSELHDLEIQLREDPGVVGQVVMADGKPAAGAIVALAMVQREAVVERGWLRHAEDAPPKQETDRWRWPRFVTTDADGRFQLPAENDPTAAVLIVHDSGVREASLTKFKEASEVSLQSWGRIEGRVQWGEASGGQRNVSLSVHRDTYGYPGVIAQYEKTMTEDNGNFTFERVLPGRVQLSCSTTVKSTNNSGNIEVNLPGMVTHLTVVPGPNAALIGGQGRRVIGRLTGRESWTDVTFHCHPTAPHFGWRGDSEQWSAWTEMQNSPLGPIFFRNGLKVGADGGFEISRVLPGSYQIIFSRAGEKQFLASSQFVVSAETPGAIPEAQDIGEIRCRNLP